MNTVAWCRRDGTALIVNLLAQPRARHSAFAGVAGERLKVRLGAPAVDGRANEHLIRFFAATFGVPRSRVQLLTGRTGRHKTVRVDQPARMPPELPAVPR